MILDIEKNADLLNRLYSEYKSRKPKYEKMYRYYKGDTDAKRNYPKTDRSNIKVGVNYIKKFIQEETSFGVGNEISYTSISGNQEAIRDIRSYLNNNKKTVDTELMTKLLTYGETYEIYYLYKGEFKIRTVTPLNSIAYCNIEDEVELFMYLYSKELDDKVYIDVFDDKYIYHLDENFKQMEEATPHYFGCCPVGKAAFIDGEFDTLYNDIHELQDAYEITTADAGNNISDLRASYLALYGAQIEENDTERIKETGILQIPEASGRAEWLTKNLEADFCKNYNDTLQDLIYQISSHINHNVVASSNTSGVALMSRLISLRNKINTNQKCISNCIKVRIKCLFAYLNTAFNKNYDYKDIQLIYTMNIPQDDVSIAQVISQLNGKLSAETGLNQLSFITNGKEEYQKALKEQRELMKDQVDLDGVNSSETE